MELISVLIPTYNVEKYVESAVRSILEQTYTNIEVIIVDDCSTDNTYTILKKLSQIDGRVKLFRNDRNLKICQTLNKGLSYANGSYIARMDGDDISRPNRLELLKRFLDENPNIDLVGSQTELIDSNGKILSKKKHLRTPRFIKFGNMFMCSVLHIWMCRRSVYDQLNGYREIPYSEDYDFLLRGENEGFNYANIEDYVYAVRIRQGNTATTNGLVQRKTALYVQKIHRMEKAGKSGFSPIGHKQAVKCNRKEVAKYKRANEMLSIALDRTNKITDRILNTIKSSLCSRYMFRYLLVATMSRVLIKLEDIFIPRRRDNNDTI